MTKALWAVAWWLIERLLKVTSDLVNATIEAVKKAETLTHEDGTPYTSAQKRAWVIKELKVWWTKEQWLEGGDRVTNMLIEAAVNYLESLKSKEETTT